MSEVKKWYIGVYGGEAQARPCSPAEFEIIRDRDRRYFVIEEDYERVTAERDALQLSLTTGDERADLLGTEVARLNRVKLALKELVESHAGNLSVYRYHLSEALAMAEKVRDASLGMQRKCLADLIDYLHQSGATLKPAESDGDSSTCTWQHVDDRGIWDTGCGTSWAFTDEGPKENGMKFCHACGKTLMVEHAGDDD